VNERNLADALHSGKVYAAALDVLSHDPPTENYPLLSAKNCIITPHISWAPIECRQRIMDITVNNVGAFVKGNPINVVSG
jgi:glycerate dehydrogenase